MTQNFFIAGKNIIVNAFQVVMYKVFCIHRLTAEVS